MMPDELIGTTIAATECAKGSVRLLPLSNSACFKAAQP
jgi:hypothetical protein